jgi:hypothetical protein
LLQILFVAALDIKTRDVPTVSSINSLLSQYCKTSLFFLFIYFYLFILFLFFFANFYVLVGAGATVRFAPVAPWAKTGPDEEHHLCSFLTINMFKFVGEMNRLNKGVHFVTAAVAIRAL